MTLHRRILIYSDTSFAMATIQIRLIGPLGRQGFELIDAHEFLRPASDPHCDQIKEFDAVVVHRGIRKRCLLYPLLISAARRHRIPVIYDVDDLLFGVPRTHPDFNVYRARMGNALKVLLDSDLVVASTQDLADNISVFHNSVVVIQNELPQSIWNETFRRNQRRSSPPVSEPVTLGYFGTATHRPDLQSIEDVLLAILRRHRGRVRFLSVGVPLSRQLLREPSVDQITPPKHIARNYSDFATFAATLKVDVGIAPLVSNVFNKCKSNIKFQEYSALGIPAVYSDLAPYQTGVRHGENGFLASTAEEWESSLEHLIESTDLRLSFTQNAMKDLEAFWKLGNAGTTWMELIASVASQAMASSKVHPVASIVNEILEYQAELERRLKYSVRYQTGKFFSRLMKKWAA